VHAYDADSSTLDGITLSASGNNWWEKTIDNNHGFTTRGVDVDNVRQDNCVAGLSALTCFSGLLDCTTMSGVPGNAGAQGPQGPQGLKGDAGDDGTIGPAGTDGAGGAQGPAGQDGAGGAQGPAGPAGQDGTNGTNGADGPQGPAGPAGPAGQDGAGGAQGPAGPAGQDGNDGQDGTIGPAGPAGPAAEQEYFLQYLSICVSVLALAVSCFGLFYGDENKHIKSITDGDVTLLSLDKQKEVLAF